MEANREALAVWDEIIALLHEIGVHEGNVGLWGQNVPGEGKTFRQGGFTFAAGDAREGAGLAAAVLAGPAGEGLCAALYALCQAQKIPLVAAFANPGHISNVLRLVAGGENTAGAAGAETLVGLEAAGFVQIARGDVRRDAAAPAGPMESLADQRATLAHQYLCHVKTLLDADALVATYLRAYTAGAFVAPNRDEKPPARPFLSVLTRTQGNRIDELRETLLCLCAQTDGDFEVLLVGHKVAAQNAPGLAALLEEFPAAFRKKIRYFALDTGNRSAPLNYGVENARGDYLSILDDDDLVMDHWVETFRQGAARGAGTILHAYCVRQKWERGELPGALRAVAKPERLYCRPFNYVAQTVENFCPTMSLAFPVCAFQNTSLRFDETLDTNEDWDLLMRMVFLTGVTDLPEVTSIYRQWANAQSSATLHGEAHWKENYDHARRNIDRAPVLLPPGSADVLRKYYMDSLYYKDMAEQYSEDSFKSILYLSAGQGFREEDTVCLPNHTAWPKFHYRYELGRDDPVSDLRFDPTEQGEILVKKIEFVLHSAGGKSWKLGPENYGHNGLEIDGKTFFMKEDPQYFFAVPGDFALKTLEVKGEISAPLSVGDKRLFWSRFEAENQRAPGLLRRVWRRLRGGG